MMISDEYIKMCQQAKELQDSWQPKDFDLFLFEDKDSDEGFIDSIPLYFTKNKEVDHDRTPDEIYKNNCIWLPRQEDLQQIWFEKYETSSDKRDNFISMLTWFMIVEEKYSYKLGSMEGYTLALLMYEIYNKRWDFETKQWIKK